MWLDSILRALDEARRPTRFFFRDDDAGWSDDTLWALLDVFDRAAAPIDLAVIPDALNDTNTLVLNARRNASEHSLGLHQHGSAHRNHQTQGRKCEFGDARSFVAQFADIQSGQAQLAQRLDRVDSIFTPPWNRCNADTTFALHALGFNALSRDFGATPTQSLLPEIAIHVDWCKHDRNSHDAQTELGRRIATTVTKHSTVGLMLHHAVMSKVDYLLVATLLSALRDHPFARFSLMRDVPAPPHTQQSQSVHEFA